MALSEHLDYPAAEESEYQPRTEYDGSSGYIQTGPLEETPKDFDALLRQFGYDPEQVRIVGHPRVARWQQRARKMTWSDEHDRYIKTSVFETVWLEAYRFHLAPVGNTSAADLESLIAAAKPVSNAEADGYWFVFQAGDLQLGKRSRDGSTEQIIEKFLESVEAAKAELQKCPLPIAGVQISMPGDCLEGVVSQGSKNMWLTQETITEQTRILRRLMLHVIDVFRTMVPKVYLDTVNGNHDQAQRMQNSYPGDGWATECAVAVADAMKLNPAAYGHVEVRVPQQWSGMMTVPVGDTNVCIVHGHQWRNENNMWKWLGEQAVNHQPAGGAHVIQSGHFHSWRVTSNEHKTHIQSPTFDCGSDWYREAHGATSTRGALVYLLRSGEVSRMSLV